MNSYSAICVPNFQVNSTSKYYTCVYTFVAKNSGKSKKYASSELAT